MCDKNEEELNALFSLLSPVKGRLEEIAACSRYKEEEEINLLVVLKNDTMYFAELIVSCVVTSSASEAIVESWSSVK